MFDPAPFDPAGPVLGIDPGLSRCGYGVVAGERNRPRAVGYGVITTPPDAPLPDRLLELDDELRLLIAQTRPSAVAVERVLFQSNARTAISVGQASGLALVAAARLGIPVVLYSPNEVKLAVTGNGRADKAAVQMMVARLLNLSGVPKPPDAADALALACCHLWRAPLAAQVGTKTGARVGTDVGGRVGRDVGGRVGTR